MPLILASASAIRRSMLEQAGVQFTVAAASLDEAVAKATYRGGPSGLAELLAHKKALNVSEQRTGDWVIGSDSVVVARNRQFDKPEDRAQAAEHLRFFSGKPLELTSAVAIARDGIVDWSYSDTAMLRVRQLSEQFIQDYLDAEWPEVGYCVGVFRLEGRGVQLFDAIEGSYFTILGMPLLPLLKALRERECLAS